MFDKEAFAKNQFILENISFDYTKTIVDAIKPMHVAFNINDSFFMQTGVAITSILENNKEKSFWFHIFCDGVSDENKDKVRQTMEKYSMKCSIYIMDMEPFQAFHIKTRHFSRVTYLRSIMPKILKGLTDRYLYMDADMICTGDISEIERIDLQGYPFAAASETDEAVRYKTTFLKMKSDKYFNDGLMWVDIAEWEREEITEKVFSYQGADPRRFSGQSQDILNLVLEGEICFISRRFNGMDDGNLIYHFTGRNKPWQLVLDEPSKIWRHYLDLSVWDSMPDPNPPKDPEHYFNWKLMMIHNRYQGNYGGMLYCMYWYSCLKIKLVLRSLLTALV